LSFKSWIDFPPFTYCCMLMINFGAQRFVSIEVDLAIYTVTDWAIIAMKTRGDVLRFAIAFALMRAHKLALVAGFFLGRSDAEFVSDSNKRR